MTIKKYTFSGEPNMLATIAGINDYAFRFDKKGKLEVFDLNPFIERLKKRFPYKEEDYRLTKVVRKRATSPKKE